MPWTEITMCVVLSLMTAGIGAFFIRWIIVERLGKHISTVRTGKLITTTYHLDEQTRQHVRRGTLIGFVVMLVISFACWWSFIGMAPAF